MFKVCWRNEFDTIKDEDDECFMVMWDYDNEEIDDIMNNEIRLSRYTGTTKKNMLWLKKIKEMSKLRDTIYISTKQNCDGCFYVWINNWEHPSRCKEQLEDLKITPFNDFKLEEDGSVYMNNYSYETFLEWEKVDCAI